MRRLLNEILPVLIFSFSSALIAGQTLIEVIPLRHRPASELRPLIVPLLEHSDRVIDNGDKLIVKTTAERLPGIRSLINKLDTPLTNLAITVIQSRYKTARELNAEASIDVTVPKHRRASGAMGGHIASTDRLDKSESSQVIRTLEGRPAYIKTGRLQPVDSITIYDSGYGFPTYSLERELIETSTGFIVIPRLSGSWVTLEVSPWNDSMHLDGSLKTHSAHSNLRVKLGEWVEIGASEEDGQRDTQGYLRHRRTTKQESLHILLKVETVN